MFMGSGVLVLAIVGMKIRANSSDDAFLQFYVLHLLAGWYWFCDISIPLYWIVSLCFLQGWAKCHGKTKFSNKIPMSSSSFHLHDHKRTASCDLNATNRALSLHLLSDGSAHSTSSSNSGAECIILIVPGIRESSNHGVTSAQFV